MDSGPLKIKPSNYVQTPACNLGSSIVAITALNKTDVKLNITGTQLVIQQSYLSSLDQKTLVWNIQTQIGSIVNSDSNVAIEFVKFKQSALSI
jgi:hypothetical protein